MRKGIPNASTRMVTTGLPVLVASGLLYVLPLAARPFLSDAEYATWALGAVVLSITLVFDFGATPYVLAAEGAGSLDRARFVRATVLAVLGSLAPGLVLALLWLPYSAGKDLALTGPAGSAFLLSVAAGGALRSAALVATGLMLVRGELRRRTVAVLSQALLQATVVVALLALGAGVWALPLGGVIAGAAMCLYAFRPFPRWERAALDDVHFGDFLRARLGTTTLSLSLTQLDRWVVGALVPVGLLARYDLAARLAGLPRLVVIALSGVLAADAAVNRTDRQQLSRIYRAALRACGAVVVVLGLATVTAGLLVHQLSGRSLDPALLTLLVVAFSLHALTAVGTQMMSGIGVPAVEYLYLVPCCALVVAIWTAAWFTGSHTLAVAAAPTGFAVTSVVFLIWMGRRASAGRWARRTPAPSALVPEREVPHGR
ncbi:MATE family efflux transporter [Luteipulveratus halotolerans]|uniref:hypothetical protein n=1 Tax=Luteipulveratus halotolerans TaxID=1631356 RepID=UPI00068213A0|nr:hypothetical protein [Luteipulveratus halotolerans]